MRFTESIALTPLTVFAAINCIGMAVENPYIKEHSMLHDILYWSDVGFTCIFGVEVRLLGLYGSHHAVVGRSQAHA